jgi:hypothetical protein
MRQTIAFVVILLIVFSAKAQWAGNYSGGPAQGELPITNSTKAGLIGPIKSIRVEQTKVVNEAGKKIEGSRQLSSIDSYDTRGNITGFEFYLNGKMLYKDRYVYGLKDRLIESSRIRPDGTQIWRDTYTYDLQGRVTESSNCKETLVMGGIPGGVPGSNTPPPPPPKGPFCEKYRYTYDARGYITEKTMYDSNYHAPSRTVYRQDADGNITALITYQDIGDRTHFQATTYNYDANGNLIEMVNYPMASVGQQNLKPYLKYVYAYDALGRRITWTTYERDILKSKWIYTYEIDATGNWIKRITSESKTGTGQSSLEPIAVMYRTITYYPEQRNTK